MRKIGWTLLGLGVARCGGKNLADTRMFRGWAQWDECGGVPADMPLATPAHMRAAADIHPGEQLRSLSGGPVCVVSVRKVDCGRWVRIPPMALGNRREIWLAEGQGVLVESSAALRLTGSMAAVVPAAALRHWRGITPRPRPSPAFQFTLSRPALVLGGAGEAIAFGGPANDALGHPIGHLLGAELGTADLPPVPSLSLPSAQQLIACLIAYEAGAMLRGLHPQAAFCAPNRP